MSQSPAGSISTPKLELEEAPARRTAVADLLKMSRRNPPQGQPTISTYSRYIDGTRLGYLMSQSPAGSTTDFHLRTLGKRRFYRM